MSARHRVVVADDHPYTRTGVRMALEPYGFEIVAETGTADGAVQAVERYRPDVAVLDVHMPGGGVTAARRILQHWPDTAVVMLTVSESGTDLLAALSAGVNGYVLKDMAADRLAPTLEAVLEGETAIPRRLTTALADQFRSRTAPRSRIRGAGGSITALTAREREVAELLCRNQSTARMALKLHLSEVTVRRHVSGLIQKLGVGGRAELVELLQPQFAGESGEETAFSD